MYANKIICIILLSTYLKPAHYNIQTTIKFIYFYLITALNKFPPSRGGAWTFQSHLRPRSCFPLRCAQLSPLSPSSFSRFPIARRRTRAPGTSCRFSCSFQFSPPSFPTSAAWRRGVACADIRPSPRSLGDFFF